MSVRSTALDGPETRLPPPEDPPSPRLPAGSLTSPLRAAGYAAVLTALAFIQGAGLMVADTKFDLLVAPGRFLARSLQLWDPEAAFGQVPDQSYGYAWPMGPFFALGHLVDMPPWMIQRLWWALLLVRGVLRHAAAVRAADAGQRADPGRRGVRLRAHAAPDHAGRRGVRRGLADGAGAVGPPAAGPRVEARGPYAGLPRPARSSSAAAAASTPSRSRRCCPLGVIWLLTREPGPRRWRLLGWWTLFTVLATAWWSGPLLLLGRYAPPFLDYIENASITTAADRPDPQPAGRLGLGRLLRRPRLRGRPPRGRHAVPPGRRGARRGARAGRHVPARQPAPQVPGLGPAGRRGARRLRLRPRPPGLLRRGPDASRSTSRWPRSATSTSSTSSCGSR